jgi:hypothetical protein
VNWRFVINFRRNARLIDGKDKLSVQTLTVLTRDVDLSRICLDLMETKHHDVPLDVALRPLHFERVDLLGADIARDYGGVVGSKSDPATAFGCAS